ncbi:hypothetical protein CVT25_012097 [Psilocybe cyanescens]|uniref:Uncharacterized protein n=1 Tax=Psilocybe cyanescens TaxID=93625 RepID=A0A409VMX8_PSICY|nr:hypothetical protein CVT25_012097 [Psilocybe cyanescens]
MSARKPPRCRSCKHPMKGHNKLGLCLSASPEVLSREEEDAADAAEYASSRVSVSAHSYMSPPPTPPPASSYAVASSSDSHATPASMSMGPPPLLLARNRVHRTYTPAIMAEPSFIIPETGYFHRRNPNFVHPHAELLDANGDGDAAAEDGGSGSQTPTVIIGSDGESAAALSDRSGSASPGPGPSTPRANHYHRLGLAAGSSYLDGTVAVHPTSGDAAEICERAAHLGLQTAVVCAPRPTPPRRNGNGNGNGSAFAGGLAYLGSFNWIRSPSPQDTYVVAGAKHANVAEFASRLQQRHQQKQPMAMGGAPLHLHPHQAHALATPEYKFSTRDLFVMGLVVVVGSAMSMVLVLYFGKSYL